MSHGITLPSGRFLNLAQVTTGVYESEDVLRLDLLGSRSHAHPAVDATTRVYGRADVATVWNALNAHSVSLSSGLFIHLAQIVHVDLQWARLSYGDDDLKDVAIVHFLDGRITIDGRADVMKVREAVETTFFKRPGAVVRDAYNAVYDEQWINVTHVAGVRRTTIAGLEHVGLVVPSFVDGALTLVGRDAVMAFRKALNAQGLSVLEEIVDDDC